MKKAVYIVLSVLCASCGISEDCFKGNGKTVSQTFDFKDFQKIKVYNGVGLVIKQDAFYEVKVVTNQKILNKIDLRQQDGMLVIKDLSTCNLARDYGQTTVYITTPNLTELHSKTEQNIKSEGTLRYPYLKIYSLNLEEGAGTGDFYLDIETENLYVESNSVSNFYINGTSENAHIFFPWGNGIFYGENLKVNTMSFFHRGSNDMIVFPLNSLQGEIYSNGNVILKNIPPILNVQTYWTGKVKY